MALAPPHAARMVWLCAGVGAGHTEPPPRGLSEKGAGTLLLVPQSGQLGTGSLRSSLRVRHNHHVQNPLFQYLRQY